MALTGTPAVPRSSAAVGVAQRVEAWRRGLERPDPVRLCLRLSFIEHPDDFWPDGSAPSGERWLVEFLMQPLEDPSVLVPAAEVWQGRRTAVHRYTDRAQERLLTDLGRVRRLFADIDPALREPRPTDLVLDTAGAHRLLTHATLLADAGIGVLLPAWWQQRQTLGLTLNVHSRESTATVLRDQAVNRAALSDYRWHLALGGERLSETELAELARAKLPLVRLRGRWVHLDRRRLEAGLAFLARGGAGQVTAGEAFRLVRSDTEGGLPLPVTGVEGSGWLADLLAGRTEERLSIVDPPAGLTGELRPYQLRGLGWLAFLDRLGIGACLADDMGLGKTVQLLALTLHTRGSGPTLLVCPLSVLGNWQREAARFAPGLSVHVYHGPDRKLPAEPADLTLTTYAVATRDADVLAGTDWDRVVLDEAQQVKNSAGVTAQAVRRIPARHRVALTGTPVENRLAELWSILDFLNPGALGPPNVFRNRYAVPIERYGDDDAGRRLRQVVRPYVLRRLKTDPGVIQDLPEKQERRQYCPMTVEQVSLYQAVVDDMLGRMQERNTRQRKAHVLAAMTKLKQVCNHPAQFLGDGSPLPGRSGKLDRLEDILTGVLAVGDKVLLFTQFVRFGSILRPYLSTRFATQVEFLHGGTPRGGRDAMVERFQTDPACRVLIVSLKAGGTGLNLTAASHVVHLDRWWNPAVETQATDRAFRIGQHRNVQVHTLICLGTLEEKIDRLIAEKRGMASLAVGTGEGWLGGLSTVELRQLVALSPEALQEPEDPDDW